MSNETKLTIAEFRRSRTRSYGDHPTLAREGVREGYIYDGECFIEILPDGNYQLIIARDEYFSADLAELEEILFRNWYLPSCT